MGTTNFSGEESLRFYGWVDIGLNLSGRQKHDAELMLIFHEIQQLFAYNTLVSLWYMVAVHLLACFDEYLPPSGQKINKCSFKLNIAKKISDPPLVLTAHPTLDGT